MPDPDTQVKRIQPGWQCPHCKTVYAIWVRSCKCSERREEVTGEKPWGQWRDKP